MRKLLQRLWDIAADFANFMGGLGMRLVWLPKLHFSPGAEHVRTDPGPALFVLNHSWWMDAPMLCLLCRCRRISVVGGGRDVHGRAQPCHALAALHSGRPGRGRGPELLP